MKIKAMRRAGYGDRRWLFAAFAMLLSSCGSGGSSDSPSDGSALDSATLVDSMMRDVNANDANQSGAIPQFSQALYVDIAAVDRISRFRSGIGHDFADSIETCRSMKHYFCLNPCSGPHTTSWTTRDIRSPVNGTISRMENEQSVGIQLRIVPTGYSDWEVRIFHVTPNTGLAVGSVVHAGDVLGKHASDNTMSDIAIEHHTSGGYRMVSYFDTLTDSVFMQVQARGVATRETLKISAADRDAHPLSCTGQSFASEGDLPNWIDLN